MDITRLDRIELIVKSHRNTCQGAYMETNGVDSRPCEHNQHRPHDMGLSDPDKAWLVDELKKALERVKFLEARQTELQEEGTRQINVIRELKSRLPIPIKE